MTHHRDPVEQALRALEMPSPPLGFAQRLERLARAQADESAERWGVRLGVLALFGLLMAFCLIAALPQWAQWQARLPQAPWSLLVASGLLLGVIAALDLRRNNGDANSPRN